MRSLALAVVISALGCEAIIGADFSVKRGDCAHARPPAERPLADSEDEPARFFVADSIDFGENAATRDLGFDLDDRCTGQGEGPLCKGALWIDGGVLLDDVGGRDNGIARMVGAQYDVFKSQPFASVELTARIRDGRLPPIALFRISRWNGEPDDASVRVDWYTPALPEVDAGASSLTAVDVVASSTLGDDAAASDNSAYVRDNVLVASFGTVPTYPSFRLITARLAIVGAVLQMRMTSPRTGVIAGWSSASDVLEAVPLFTEFANGGVQICPNTPAYPLVKEYVCRYADFTLDGKQSNKPCDALSLGVGITLRETTLGRKLEQSPRVTCAKGETCDVPP